MKTSGFINTVSVNGQTIKKNVRNKLCNSSLYVNFIFELTKCKIEHLIDEGSRQPHVCESVN